jgi:uncharacterized transporter YbjL
MYLNVTEIESGILTLANQYPLLCERIVLPNKSVEGRTISALRIGKKGMAADRLRTAIRLVYNEKTR